MNGIGLPALFPADAVGSAIVTNPELAAFAACVFGAVTLVAFLLLSLIRRKRPVDMLAYYDQTPRRAAVRSEVAPESLRGRLMAIVASVAEKRGFTAELQTRLEAAGLPLRPVEYMALHLLLVLGSGLLALLVTGSPFFSIVIVAGAAVAPLLLLGMLTQRRRAQFTAQLPDVFGLISGSLRAGYGVMQAVDQISREMAAPVSVEFQRVQSEVRLGWPVDEALGNLAERMESDDFRWAVSAIGIQREVGGNLAEVLDIVSRTIRERDALRREVAALTSESKLSARILLAMPFVIAGVLLLLSPGYIAPMFSTPAGWGMLSLAGLLLAAGFFWLKRVSKIEV